MFGINVAEANDAVQLLKPLVKQDDPMYMLEYRMVVLCMSTMRMKRSQARCMHCYYSLLQLPRF